MCTIIFFFFKQKTAYEMQRGLVGSEMCIRDRKDRDRLRSDCFKLSPSRDRSHRARCVSLFELVQRTEERRSVLSDEQISELYAAKCQDLKLQNFRSQELRFHEYCHHFCIDRKLMFRELGLGINFVKTLRSVLWANHYISSIDLRKNSIGDAGIAELSAALKYTTSLVHLDVSSNELSYKGGCELFNAILHNESITSLDVSSHEGLHRNNIGMKGVKALIPVLQKNKILTILNLNGNKTVSYTHLTLPTILLVQISVVAVSLKKKKKQKTNEPP
eukprot:TRINITY_DN15503_c0_g1_i1.p1 TRINITY_DN15503_c0_g1~~TRINITY_DN15503_c0_g1_i1.p1  ORF type:complete len:275 (-),score=46.65 TRINITY_DN15503_c0_g1_i1:78-902(-)